MIPTMLFAGFVLGAIPWTKWWTTMLAGVAWTIAVAVSTGNSSPAVMVGAFTLGTINALVGWLIGHILVRGVSGAWASHVKARHG